MLNRLSDDGGRKGEDVEDCLGRLGSDPGDGAARASAAAGAASSVGEGGRRSVVASLFFDSVFFLVHPRPFSLVCPRRRGLGGSAAASRVGFRCVELKRKVSGVPFDSVNDTLISALSESASIQDTCMFQVGKVKIVGLFRCILDCLNLHFFSVLTSARGKSIQAAVASPEPDPSNLQKLMAHSMSPRAQVKIISSWWGYFVDWGHRLKETSGTFKIAIMWCDI
ncbi:hypothetical protein Taro_010718 [Colocasia esculenta]|uniref:Uncharacterized protein n=1 Tax=Colocasia esculenta TaxID=4460 RepID=A0A843TZP7_COLES|nr:hypothetical protein [Colocasia esculenta]